MILNPINSCHKDLDDNTKLELVDSVCMGVCIYNSPSNLNRCDICPVRQSANMIRGKSKYSIQVLKALRQREGLEPDDTSMDEIFNSYSRFRVFQEWLEWEGIINYAQRIANIIEELWGYDLGKED